MKTVKIILIVATMLSFIGCNAQNKNKITDKEFQSLLDKFVTVNPPINYKKMNTFGKDMTDKEAIKFFHKTKNDLEWIIEEMGEDDEIYTSRQKYIPGCKFKYQLNDSIYMLCIVEQSGRTIEDSSWAMLYSFDHKGNIIDKCIIRGEFSYGAKCASCIFFDKKHIRVFYYTRDYTRKDDGYLSTVYYINYTITDDGRFIEQDRSGITYLKRRVVQYSTYEPNSDDPMNKYNF